MASRSPRATVARRGLAPVVRRDADLDVVRVGLAAALADAQARDGDRDSRSSRSTRGSATSASMPVFLRWMSRAVLDVPLAVRDVGQRRRVGHLELLPRARSARGSRRAPGLCARTERRWRRASPAARGRARGRPARRRAPGAARRCRTCSSARGPRGRRGPRAARRPRRRRRAPTAAGARARSSAGRGRPCHLPPALGAGARPGGRVALLLGSGLDVLGAPQLELEHVLLPVASRRPGSCS